MMADQLQTSVKNVAGAVSLEGDCLVLRFVLSKPILKELSSSRQPKCKDGANHADDEAIVSQ